ncbi:MAG TPA: hypothetical protein VFW65_33260 [Pseudonocardiaceae bacterium]|nr:hypothetical protein [Pseudonocardiaceae bacterium]
MEIPKDKILDVLRSRGEGDKAQQADEELPGTVDTEKHSGLLAKFGVDPKELLGGLGDKLGG